MVGLDPELQEKLDAIARDVVAVDAESVDRNAAFPRAAIAALAAAGFHGLISNKDVGGLGQGPAAAAAVIRRIARECGSTGMIMTMHYAGTAVIEQHGSAAVRRDVAEGRHLSTLAFSEAGSRSHFWAPIGTATAVNGNIALDAEKSWITSAGHATAYVWSSRPVGADGASTLWLVPSNAPGLAALRPYDGLGLRGNDSQPVTARGVKVVESQRLGADGDGFAIMMGTVLPYFNLMSAAVSVGLMEAATARTATHVSTHRFLHLDSALSDLPTIRAYVARMKARTDMALALLSDSVNAVTSQRDDAMLRVLECKAAAGEAALEVLQTAMRVCGGAAYRREVGVERYFRDAHAATVMAPTTDQLYDFIGKAVCGLPLF